MGFNTTADAKAIPRRMPAMPAVERLEYGLPSTPEEASARATAGVSPLPAFQSVTNKVSGSFEPVEALQSQDSESMVQTVGAEVDWALMAAELEARLIKESTEAKHAMATARDEGRREGQHAAEVTFTADRHENYARVTNALETFRIERQQYFKNVEMEVVHLALAIAARVLHREAQMDPLFLAGAVRVALDKLADSSGVVLRVSHTQIPVWQEIFQTSSGMTQPEILGDSSLAPGECVLETRLGTIEVGVQAQLEEIEKGFFDLLDQQPSFHDGIARRSLS